jgi:hypothetical protein
MPDHECLKSLQQCVLRLANQSSDRGRRGARGAENNQPKKYEICYVYFPSPNADSDRRARVASFHVVGTGRNENMRGKNSLHGNVNHHRESRLGQGLKTAQWQNSLQINSDLNRKSRTNAPTIAVHACADLGTILPQGRFQAFSLYTKVVIARDRANSQN